VKPFLLRHLVERTGGPVLYLDSDIYLYGSIDDLGEMIEHEGALVSPHARAPYPLDGLLPDDTTILSAGTFNAGVLGAGPKGLALMEFLISRLRRECKIAVDEMRVNEQRWLDLLPSYGPCHILRDPGVNAAYWNLHERPLRRVGGRILAGDAPLRAFHFSGYSPAQPDTLTTYVRDRGRILLSDHPVVRCARSTGPRLSPVRRNQFRCHPTVTTSPSASSSSSGAVSPMPRSAWRCRAGPVDRPPRRRRRRPPLRPRPRHLRPWSRRRPGSSPGSKRPGRNRANSCNAWPDRRRPPWRTSTTASPNWSSRSAASRP